MSDEELIVVLDKTITCLQDEIQVKDELIQKQEALIAILQENNTALEKLLKDILNP